MKFIRLSTTSKLYLLTLLFIFAIIFINQSVFAQSQSASTTSQKRLATMELYASWINGSEYGQFKNELGNKALKEFNAFLTTALMEDKDCLTSNSSSASESTFVQNIENFFSVLTGQSQPPVDQLSSCKGKIKDDYKLAKKYNRLLKYLQIEEGDPNVCIRADLGVGTALLAHGFNPTKVPLRQLADGGSDNPKETGVSGKLPLYLCTGNDGKKKVRVVDDSGTRLRLSTEDAQKPEFQVSNLPPKGSFDTLVQKLGL